MAGNHVLSGTNPEAMRVIDCRRDNGETAWSYGFVPLAAAVTARLDGEVVWINEPTTGPRRREGSSTWLENDEM